MSRCLSPRRQAAALAFLALLTASPGWSQNAEESAFDAHLSAEDQRGWIERLASGPNHVGSAHNLANAEFLLASFREWGWDARIETFDVLYPTPIATRIELIAPERMVLGGQEPAVPGDPGAPDASDTLPPYVAYQGDGDVTADLVYVNYGTADDYAALARRGIDVRGKVVIARYGRIWRGLKPKIALEHGAIGCIIYSDPADDGFARGAVYPDGGSRPPAGVQRGSVSDVTLYPGDPLTPGEPSVDGIARLDRFEAATIVQIPTLPISYADALVLLSRLGGRVAPSTWRGALPITYRLGGDETVQVRLAVTSDWATHRVNNVIAVLPGAARPDEWVIRGNHFDAWNFGAWDPMSGMASMMSEAKAMGAMVRDGWRPGRTIVYTAWDGEEPGMLGSTEWAEFHAEELRAKGVIYINTDSNGRGILYGGGNPDYQQLLTDVAGDVPDPETDVSIAARRRASLRVGAADGSPFIDPAAVAAAETGEDVVLFAAGAGSDHTAFAHFVGLPVLGVGFGGENESGGIYHSIYDNYRQWVLYGDPGLEYGVALSQVVGRLVLRTADAETSPQRFGPVATTLAGYLTELKRWSEQTRVNSTRRQALIADGSFVAASDPAQPVAPPADEPGAPMVVLTRLEAAIERLRVAAEAYDAALAEHGDALPLSRRGDLNASLRDIDQLLLDDRGLPGRSWYRNLTVAPGRFDGYGATTFPGIREAMEDGRVEDADTFVERIAAAIDAYSARLGVARSILIEPTGTGS